MRSLALISSICGEREREKKVNDVRKAVHVMEWACTCRSTLSKQKPTRSLQEYIESFDQTTLVETASILSIEAGNLLQEHTTALFGDLQVLQKEMMDAIGDRPAGGAQVRESSCSGARQSTLYFKPLNVYVLVSLPSPSRPIDRISSRN